VDAAAADPDPIGRVLRLARRVLRGSRDRPVTGDRAEERAALLERALVVTEPVARLSGVRPYAQELAVGVRRRARSGPRDRCERAGDGGEERDWVSHLGSPLE